MKSFKDFIIEGKKSKKKAAERKPTIERDPRTTETANPNPIGKDPDAIGRNDFIGC